MTKKSTIVVTGAATALLANWLEAPWQSVAFAVAAFFGVYFLERIDQHLSLICASVAGMQRTQDETATRIHAIESDARTLRARLTPAPSDDDEPA